jgi:hypothetical protein
MKIIYAVLAVSVIRGGWQVIYEFPVAVSKETRERGGGYPSSPRQAWCKDFAYGRLIVMLPMPRLTETPFWVALRSMTTPLSFFMIMPLAPPKMAMPALPLL